MTADATTVVRETGVASLDGVVDSPPKLVTEVILILPARVVSRAVKRLVRGVQGRPYPSDRRLVPDLGAPVVAVLLWFGTALAVLGTVGLGGVATSLGTSAGFVALGVAYALSNTTAGTVAGGCLLRDPGLDTGDTVTSGCHRGRGRHEHRTPKESPQERGRRRRPRQPGRGVEVDPAHGGERVTPRPVVWRR